MRAGFKHLPDKHRIFVTRKDQHPHMGQFLGYAAQDIDTVQPWELRVEDAHVGVDVEAELNRCLTVTGLPNELIVGVKPQNLDQHFANSGLVFDYDEAFHWQLVRKGTVVGRPGFEPGTNCLKGNCSTIELPAPLSVGRRQMGFRHGGWQEISP